MAEIELREVWKVYRDGTVAVRSLGLEIADGEFMVFVGPSGCGKTTALRMVAGLEDISSGEVRIGGRVVNDVRPRDRDVAMVFQNYALYPHLTVAENIGFGLKLRRMPKDEIARRVRRAAGLLGIGDLLERRPRALSGGQRQRVAMGRAIVREPAAFLMDEPLSNLDAKLRVQTRTEILRIQKDLAATTLYVTHDQVEAMTMGDRVAVMRKGVVQQVDAPERLYHHPANLFVGGFIGSPAMNLLPARLETTAPAASAEPGDADLVAHIGDHRIPLAGEIVAAHPGLAERVGDEIVMGIRPEDLTDVHTGDGAAATVDITAELVERLGSEILVHFRLDVPPVVTDDTRELAADRGDDVDAPRGGIELVARLGPHSPVREGDRLPLAIDLASAHFFDPASGRAIAAASGSRRLETKGATP